LRQISDVRIGVTTYVIIEGERVRQQAKESGIE